MQWAAKFGGYVARAAPQLDAASLTLENGIFYSFDKVIRLVRVLLVVNYTRSASMGGNMCLHACRGQLDPEWHRVSFRTKQVVFKIII